MFIKIGNVVLTKSTGAQYTIRRYAGAQLGFSGRVQSEEDAKLTDKNCTCQGKVKSKR
jgi:hypothetical protein